MPADTLPTGAAGVPPPRHRPRVAVIFTNGRRARLESREETPSELFYGYVELKRWGWDVDLLEESDLATAHRSRLGRIAARILPPVAHVSSPRLMAMALAGTISRLNAYDLVLVTNQQLGVELGVLASMGFLDTPIVSIVMGLLPLEPRGVAETIAMRGALRRNTVVTISRGEHANLARRLGAAVDLRYVPFGVDHRFWTPSSLGSGGYVLSVGNDQHRDFGLLTRIWRQEWPTLRIITTIPIASRAPNIEIIRGHFNQRVLTDVEMRGHVQGALFTVIPIVDTLQPSGQSAALQAMACGVPLVISDTAGLWDRDVMRDGLSCMLVRNGDDGSMSAAIERVMSSASLRLELGAAGRTAVERHFTADLMAAELGRVLTERLS